MIFFHLRTGAAGPEPATSQEARGSKLYRIEVFWIVNNYMDFLCFRTGESEYSSDDFPMSILKDHLED